MTTRTISLPTLALIAGTRVALGIGIGMLLSNRLTSTQRQAAGTALFALGALSTIPLAAEVVCNRKSTGARIAVPQNASYELAPE